MNIVLTGAEFEENLGIRYIASTLEANGHQAHIIAFNYLADISATVKKIFEINPEIIGLSMIFTNRAKEFLKLAKMLRQEGYTGHITAGGPFASFHGKDLLKNYPELDSVAIGEGEFFMKNLAVRLDDPAQVPGILFKQKDGVIISNAVYEPINTLDDLPFPKRTGFHEYFGKPIANILSSRGCWRNCHFCSISAWYENEKARKFRVRSVENLAAEMKELYDNHGVRIFNFQDDNFYLPNKGKALERFKALRDLLFKNGVKNIAIAIKARPDSITRESMEVLDDLGLFRVFLGVENASENGLKNLNRRHSVKEVKEALSIINEFGIHVAFNLLMFEPDTTMEDILENLRFMETHIENPFNFCRAEVYTSTGLEVKLRGRGKLLGDYFAYDYRIEDNSVEIFHSIVNYVFFDRNFSDNGLHYFNMQVDFCYQLLRRFYPDTLTQALRASVRNFIKKTNLDTYEIISNIYDFTVENRDSEAGLIQYYAKQQRRAVEIRGESLYHEGEKILAELQRKYNDIALKGSLEKKPAFVARAKEEILDRRLVNLPHNGTGYTGEIASINSPVYSSIFSPQVARIFSNPSIIPYETFINEKSAV